MKSERNKTINTTIEEGKKYLDKCFRNTEEIKELEIEKIKNKTIIGDTLEVLPKIQKEVFDLVIVDPPYNLTKNYNGNKFNKRNEEEYREYTKGWVEKIVPLMKKTATIYVCCDWESSLIIGDVLKDYFVVRNRITWQREKGRGAKANWKNGMEDIWFATGLSDEYVFNLDAVKIRKRVIAPYRNEEGKAKDWVEEGEGKYRDTCPSNFWDDITIPFWSMAENTAHPTQKPEKLIAKIMMASSNEGSLVLDPFLGSGTTSVVAKKLGRNYVGIEMNEQYCVWTEQRLEMAEKDKTIQGYSDGVFWERNRGIDK